MFNPIPFILAVLFLGLVAQFMQRDSDQDQTTSADLPRAWLAYHGAELSYHYANLGVAGTLPPPPATDAIGHPTAFASCLSGKILMTYLVGFVAPPQPGAVVADARALYAGDTGIGLASAGSLATPYGPVTLPCGVADKTPVVVTQVAP